MKRPVLLLVAAGLLAIVVAGALFALRERDPDSTSPTPAATGGDAALPTVPTTLPAADPSALRWERVAQDTFKEGTDLRAVARTAAGYVAVGEAGGHGAAWTSDDGIRWEQVGSDPFPEGSSLNAVAADGDLVVATGGIDEAGASVWVSRDSGASFTPEAETALAEVPATVLRAVAVSERGIVVAGADLGERPSAAVWHSADGTAWQRATSRSLAADADLRIVAVTATSAGFTAVGTTDDLRPVAWTSTDGLGWRRTEVASDGEAVMSAASAGTELTVAAGNAAGDVVRPAMWKAGADGAWSTIDTSALAPGLPANLWTAAATTRGDVVAGSIEDTPASRGGLWVSTDTVTWQEVDSEALRSKGGMALWGVAGDETSIVTVGGEVDLTTQRPTAVVVVGQPPR